MKGKWTTHKVYIGEEALKVLDEILKAQEEKEKKEKPNGKAKPLSVKERA